MKTSELDYELPEELIAQQPLPRRSDSRLLVLARDHENLEHRRINEISEYFCTGDCLVLNDTKVIPARFFLRRESGGRIEGLFLNISDVGYWRVLLKNAGRIKKNEVLTLFDFRHDKLCAEYRLRIHERLDDGHWLLGPEFSESHLTVLDKTGITPLPPYIHRKHKREHAALDHERYQTVYAKLAGSVAAPTAGLHFTPELLNTIEQKGVHLVRLTLHVGLGTFKPVTVDDLQDHVMHEEFYRLDSATAEIINQTLDNQKRVIAVGTTSVRTLETLADNDRVTAGSGSTRLFITPGYRFQIAKAMLTNFHLPRSTLLALVCAFAGKEKVLDAYTQAVQQRYRFFSYGDAMLVI